jgi:hypothetical protein
MGDISCGKVLEERPVDETVNLPAVTTEDEVPRPKPFDHGAGRRLSLQGRKFVFLQVGAEDGFQFVAVDVVAAMPLLPFCMERAIRRSSSCSSWGPGFPRLPNQVAP